MCGKSERATEGVQPDAEASVAAPSLDALYGRRMRRFARGMGARMAGTYNASTASGSDVAWRALGDALENQAKGAKE